MIDIKRTTGEHPVVWLDVAVNQSFLVGVLQTQTGKLLATHAGLGKIVGLRCRWYLDDVTESCNLLLQTPSLTRTMLPTAVYP